MPIVRWIPSLMIAVLLSGCAAPARNVSFIVTDKETGQAIQGARILCIQGSFWGCTKTQKVQTDSQGQAILYTVDNKFYYRANGYVSMSSADISGTRKIYFGYYQVNGQIKHTSGLKFSYPIRPGPIKIQMVGVKTLN